MSPAGDDPVREYTPEEQRTLTEQLLAITREVHAGVLRGRPLDLTLMRDIHRVLFLGVRRHAGRIRERGEGTEHLVFGPHRSPHRDEVRRLLDVLFSRVEREVRALEDAGDEYEVEAIRLAVWAHAEIVRIHPFEDGNGRTSRLCAAHLLVRLGLRPVAIEAVKQEYTEALNHYYTARDIEPLVDLYVRLYPLA
ncbi:MAG: Fic family protein [Polyangiaceae bacterium]|nr:Fic family protein [Polyangiaceae bacterium]